jgi:hypothetical protein
LLAELTASSSCDIDFRGACYDPTPEVTTTFSCDGNVVVTESFRGFGTDGSKCALMTTRMACQEPTPTCLAGSCERVCSTDDDCPGGYCPFVDAGTALRICVKYLGEGDPCAPGGPPCAAGLSCESCVPLPILDASTAAPGDASPSDSAAGLEMFADADDGTVEAGVSASPAFPCASVGAKPGYYSLCVPRR